MRTIVIAFAALALACPASTGVAATPGRFNQYPDISGSTIVFTWEDDLWTVPATGGMATRLTDHPGSENVPKFSPDGRPSAGRLTERGSSSGRATRTPSARS